MVAWTRVIMIEMSDVKRVNRCFGGSGNGLGGEGRGQGDRGIQDDFQGLACAAGWMMTSPPSAHSMLPSVS